MTTGEKGQVERSFRASAVAVVALAAAVAACSSVKVATEAAPGAAFEGFRTFEVKPSRSIADPGLSGVVRTMIAAELRGKGLEEVEGGADLVVTYDGMTGSREQIATGIGYAVETTGGETTVYTVSRGVPVGVLVVSLVQRSDGKVVWQAKAQAGLKEGLPADKRLDRLERAITAMFSRYPPD